jgi:hypothetical protein
MPIEALSELIAPALDERLVSEFRLPADHDRRLQRLDFTGYDFRGGHLHGAVLNGAMLRHANLQGVDLSEATLENCRAHAEGNLCCRVDPVPWQSRRGIRQIPRARGPSSFVSTRHRP